MGPSWPVGIVLAERLWESTGLVVLMVFGRSVISYLAECLLRYGVLFTAYFSES